MDTARLFNNAAKIIDLSEMIIQMKQQLHQYIAGRSFRSVEKNWVLRLHLLRSKGVQRFPDHRNKLFQLSYEIISCHSFSAEFLVAGREYTRFGQE